MAIPSDISGLNLWLKSDEDVYSDAGGMTPANLGELVQVWSGIGFGVSQPTAENRPKYVVNNGVKGVCLDYWRPDSQGGARALYIPDDVSSGYPTHPQDFTAMVVVELNTLDHPGSVSGDPDRANFILTLGDVHGAADPTRLALAVQSGFIQVQYDEDMGGSGSQFPPSSKCVIVWRGNDEDIIVYLNSFSAAVSYGAAQNNDTMHGGEIGGANGGWFTVYEVALYDHDIGETYIGQLIDYAVQKYGITVAPSRQIFIDGDSLSEGFGATLNRPFWRRLSIQENLHVTCYAVTGQTLADAALNPEIVNALSFVGTSDDWVFAKLGTNDIRNGASPGDVYDDLVDYCDDLRTAGADKIVVWTLNHNDNYLLERDNFNETVRSDFDLTRPIGNPYVFAAKPGTTYADYLVDVAGHPLIGVNSSHSFPYWVDNAAHLADSGYAVEAEIVSALFTRKVEGARIDVGPETSNVRPITVQLTDANGDDTLGRHQVTIVVYADANGDAYATTGGSTGIAIGTDGALLSLVAKKAFIATCEGDGDIDLTWTDTGSEAVYLGVILPNGRTVISSKIQNAA